MRETGGDKMTAEFVTYRFKEAVSNSAAETRRDSESGE